MIHMKDDVRDADGFVVEEVSSQGSMLCLLCQTLWWRLCPLLLPHHIKTTFSPHPYLGTLPPIKQKNGAHLLVPCRPGGPRLCQARVFAPGVMNRQPSLMRSAPTGKCLCVYIFAVAISSFSAYKTQPCFQAYNNECNIWMRDYGRH